MNNLSAILFFSLSLLPAAGSATELTSDYLVGRWCFAFFDDKGEKQANNQSWEFTDDGEFRSQMSEYSTVTKPIGQWEIKDDTLKIYPGYMDTYSEVEIVSDDDFVLKWLVDMYIERGECTDPSAQ